MPHDQLAVLTRQLRVARRNLAEDAPHSPAWSATTEWVDELEAEIRELRAPLNIVTAVALMERRRLIA
jgi:hypothetical protein